MSKNNDNSKDGRFGTFVAGFLMGGLVGATVAFLKAPQSGRETREQIQTKSTEWQDTAEETVDDALSSVKAAAQDLSNRAEVFRALSQAAMDEAQKQWAQATEEIKQVAMEAIVETKAAAAEAREETMEMAAEPE
jgi:gas vesicle protein